MNNIEGFNLKLASECIEAFSVSTGLGTSITGFSGEVFACSGNGCDKCGVCEIIKQYTKKDTKCADSHIYGMMQAERFGGKYIYFCPCGFNFIVSPIFSEDIPVAYAKAGPFLMVDRDDYVKYDLGDLMQIPADKLAEVERLIDQVPYIAPDRVTKYSTLLFMSIGFINNITICNTLIKNKDTAEIQGHIGEMLSALKAEEDSDDEAITYPFQTEGLLVDAIVDGNKESANQFLNDLLGYIFFYSGGNFEIIRVRIYELLVLISRAAVEGGVDSNYIFTLNNKYFKEIHNITSIDELCFWLVDIMNKLTDYVFRFNDVKHIDVIRKAVEYIRRNYSKRITLEDVAAHVFLSPSYFSKVFKEEMNCNFNMYLNKIRIEKSKQLLLSDKVKLVDISGLVGFEDQSYFSKVFKKVTGVTPGKFRETRGKIGKTEK